MHHHHHAHLHHAYLGPGQTDLNAAAAAAAAGTPASPSERALLNSLALARNNSAPRHHRFNMHSLPRQPRNKMTGVSRAVNTISLNLSFLPRPFSSCSLLSLVHHFFFLILLFSYFRCTGFFLLLTFLCVFCFSFGFFCLFFLLFHLPSFPISPFLVLYTGAGV